MRLKRVINYGEVCDISSYETQTSHLLHMQLYNLYLKNVIKLTDCAFGDESVLTDLNFFLQN